MSSKQEQYVRAFFEKCQREDPKKFEEVAKKYPIITPRKQKAINEREIPLSKVNSEHM